VNHPLGMKIEMGGRQPKQGRGANVNEGGGKGVNVDTRARKGTRAGRGGKSKKGKGAEDGDPTGSPEVRKRRHSRGEGGKRIRVYT